MKKILLLVATVMTISLFCCSKNGDGVGGVTNDSFKYTKENLYGTWKSVMAKIDGQWTDLSQPPYHYEYIISITLNSDGTCSIGGDFGIKNGKYTTQGDEVVIRGSESYWMRIKIVSLSDSSTEVTIMTEHKTIEMQLKKHFWVTGIELSESEVTVSPTTPVTLVATIFPENATNKTVIWKSDNPRVATVEDGIVKAGNISGNTTITATTDDGSFTATCKVKVNSVLILLPAELQLEKGSIKSIQCTLLDGTPCVAARWDNSSSQIVKLEQNTDEDGSFASLYGISEGTAQITTYHPLDVNTRGRCEVTVNPLSGLQITYMETPLEDAWGIVSCRTLSGDTYVDPEWETSDPSIITVSKDENKTGSAFVFAHNLGTAVVTVKSKDGNKSDNYNITIQEPNIENCIKLEHQAVCVEYPYNLSIRYKISNNTPDFAKSDIHLTSIAIVTTENGDYQIFSKDLVVDYAYPRILKSGETTEGKFTAFSIRTIDLDEIKQYWKVLVKYTDSKGNSHEIVSNLISEDFTPYP